MVVDDLFCGEEHFIHHQVEDLKGKCILTTVLTSSINILTAVLTSSVSILTTVLTSSVNIRILQNNINRISEYYRIILQNIRIILTELVNILTAVLTSSVNIGSLSTIWIYISVSLNLFGQLWNLAKYMFKTKSYMLAKKLNKDI